jgi:hypothetical protein
MGISFILPLTFLIVFCGQNTEPAKDNSTVTVVSFKWSTIHETYKKQDAPTSSPPPEMTAANKSAARAARVNNPMIPDPNENTIDGRSAAMEKAVQEARNTPGRSSADRFEYVARIRNAADKPIDVIFWEYEFIDPANSNSLTRRHFLCGVKIKPNKELELQAFSLLGPSQVIQAATSPNKAHDPLQEKVVINRVEFVDGTIWQRRDWKFSEIRESYRRAVDNPWEGEMCRAL